MSRSVDFPKITPYTATMSKAGEAFEKLIEILATLRGPHGCPWDKEQTYQDINPYLLEEAHEVVEAIDQRNFSNLKEELGDLLVHILFHCQLACEEKKFSAAEVVEGAACKLIRRHPHVFGDKKAATTEEVLVYWEKMKQQENKGKRESILDGLPKSIPALIKAFRLGEKTSRVGFDWSDLEGIIKKVEEEMGEFRMALKSENGGQRTNARDSKTETEYGDLLFTLANLGRFLKLDPETALRKSTNRFLKRFQWIEQKARSLNQPLQSLKPKQWDELWEEAKQNVQDSRGQGDAHNGQ